VLEFTLGILVFYLINNAKLKSVLEAHPVLGKWALIVAVVCGLIVLPLQERYLTTERALSAGPPAFVVVLATILLERQYGMRTKQRWAIVLGDASYVLYLIHPYVLYGLIRIFLDPTRMGPVADAVAIVALTAAATAIAVAIHLALENPVLTWLRSRLIKRQKPAGAVAAGAVQP
jgi:peptidoglycan/LPS O-acetylase OafA/YrhL